MQWLWQVRLKRVFFCLFFAVTGRTGTMVCTWLIDSDQFESAQVPYFLKKKKREREREVCTEFKSELIQFGLFLYLAGQPGLLW